MSDEFDKYFDQELLDVAKSTMGDRFGDMVDFYVADTQRYLDSIVECLESQDIETLTREAHTIKSSSKQLGITFVGDCAMELEKNGREMIDSGDPNFNLIQDLAEKLQSSYQKTIDQIDKIR